VYQVEEPTSGKEVHPTIPALARSAGTRGAMSVRAWNPSSPPTAPRVRTMMALMPTSMRAPCKASVYMTAMSPPKTT